MPTSQQQMKIQSLLTLLRSADKSKDMDKTEEIYVQILAEPDLSFLLSKKDILDVRWNRAMNLVPIANWYLNEGFAKRPQLTRAMTCIQQALGEVVICVNGYTMVNGKEAALSFQAELQGMEKYIYSKLETISAELPEYEQKNQSNDNFKFTIPGPPTHKKRPQAEPAEPTITSKYSQLFKIPQIPEPAPRFEYIYSGLSF